MEARAAHSVYEASILEGMPPLLADQAEALKDRLDRFLGQESDTQPHQPNPNPTQQDAFTPTNQNIVRISYNPAPTLLRFHQSKAKVRGVGGPIGSGKTVAMVMEVLLRAATQTPYRNVRRTRWLIVRNTYNELKTTTLKTWQAWVPSALGPIRTTNPPTTTIRIPDIGDGTSVECEVLFLALEDEADEEKLRSFEATGIWICEAQFSDKTIVEKAQDRLGRYPKTEQDEHGNTIIGTGPSWTGLIMDFNMPDTDHFLYEAFVTERRKGWELFHQPAALLEVQDPDFPDDPKRLIWVPNPEAENIQNLANPANDYDGFRYYLDNIAGKKRSAILIDYCARWGISQVGLPVYAETYDDEVHIAKTSIKVDKSLPLLVGIDFGLHPAIIFGQLLRTGTLAVLGEIVPESESGTSLEEFLSDYYRPYLLEHFVGVRTIEGWGDPAGRGRSAIDKRSPFRLLLTAGVNCKPTYTNEFVPRKEAVEKFLMRRNGIMINPTCRKLRKAFMGGYGYPKRGGLFLSRPEKNHPWSDVSDALQYLCLGVLSVGRPGTQESRGGSNGTSF